MKQVSSEIRREPFLGRIRNSRASVQFSLALVHREPRETCASGAGVTVAAPVALRGLQDEARRWLTLHGCLSEPPSQEAGRFTSGNRSELLLISRPLLSTPTNGEQDERSVTVADVEGNSDPARGGHSLLLD